MILPMKNAETVFASAVEVGRAKLWMRFRAVYELE